MEELQSAKHDYLREQLKTECLRTSNMPEGHGRVSILSTLTEHPDICLLTCHFRQPGLNDGNSSFAEFSSVKI